MDLELDAVKLAYNADMAKINTSIAGLLKITDTTKTNESAINIRLTT